MAEIKSPKHFTPASMHRFASARMKRIEHALLEIAGTYGDVDNSVVVECDAIIENLAGLQEALDESKAEGRAL